MRGKRQKSIGKKLELFKIYSWEKKERMYMRDLQNRREKVRVRLREEMNESSHYHRDIELLFVMRGHLKICLIEQVVELHKGEFFIVNSMQKHNLKSDRGTSIMQVHIEHNLVRDIIGDDYFLLNNSLEDNNAYVAIKSAINELLYYYIESNSGKVDFAYLAHCYNILDKLMLFRQKIGQESIENEDSRILEISDYIELNYNQDISLQSLSSHLFLSPTYLSKYFKKKFGVNFKYYLTQFRLEKAASELLYSKKSLISIAFDVGFPNKPSFLKAFKETYGESPEQFRKNRQLAVEEQFWVVSKEQKEIIRTYLRSEEEDENKPILINCSTSAVKKINLRSHQMINLGDAELLLNNRFRKQVMLLKKFGIKYVKIWNVFTKGMLISNMEGELVYNFTKINEILDFLIDNDFIPHIDLRERSKIISKRVGETLKIDMGKNDFSNKLLSQLISIFLKHVIKRYGLSTIEKWRFELCIGDSNFKSTHLIEDYLECFSMIHKVCKKYSDRILLGGPGYSEHYHVDEKIWKLWKNQETKPDFISLSSYNYIVDKNNVEFGNTIRDKNSQRLFKDIVTLKNVLEKNRMDTIPVWVTEWNLTISDRNLVNDSCFKGCYILENIFMNDTNTLSYHYLSDLNSEYYDSGNFIFGGLGLIANENIIKPSGYAYSFLNELYDYCLGKGNNYIVTTDLNDNYSIICHNKQEFSNLYFATDEDKLDISEIPSYFEDKKRKLNIIISDIRTGMYKVKTRSISPNKGNLINTWKQLSFYQDLSQNDIDFIRINSVPDLDIVNIESIKNKISLVRELQANEFILIKMKRI